MGTKNLEKRLATILCKGFDDLTTMHSRFQLLDGFEGLLNRPILYEAFQNKQNLLIQAFNKELKALHLQFQQNRKQPPIHSNLPKIWLHFMVQGVQRTHCSEYE